MDALLNGLRGFFSGMWIVLKGIGLNDIIDILIIAYIIYKLFIFIRDSRAQMLLKGIGIIAAAYFIAWLCKLQMVSYIIDVIIRNAALALIVVFQPEIRSVLEHVGRSKFSFRSIIGRETDDESRRLALNTIEAVTESAKVLQMRGMGALMVFERKVPLNEIIAPATPVDGVPNVGLITNLFFNKAPLHDGAVIIRNNRICAAGCILPMTKQTDIDPDLGTRHRAAIGMSENSDAVVVVVSEETGRLSVCVNGRITSSHDPAQLKAKLIENLLPDADDTRDDQKRFFGWTQSLIKTNDDKDGREE